MYLFIAFDSPFDFGTKNVVFEMNVEPMLLPVIVTVTFLLNIFAARGAHERGILDVVEIRNDLI